MTVATTLQTLRVLLVEDSIFIRGRLRSLIEETGPAKVVVEAGTVAEALAQFAAVRPDAVVLDLNLPDGDGGTVLCAIKRTHPACVVMVLTNFSNPESRAHCLQLGADYFFEKSREFERVTDVLSVLALPDEPRFLD